MTPGCNRSTSILFDSGAGIPEGRRQISIHLSHSLAAPFGGLCLLLLPLDTRFIIKSPFFDLREKPLLGQFLLEISYGFFNLIVLYNNLHNPISLFVNLDKIIIN
jgi:hypothetical protein